MSITRKHYILRLIGRCLILIACMVVGILWPETFSVLEGNRFFTEWSLLHLLWLVWVVGVVLEEGRVGNGGALGCR